MKITEYKKKDGATVYRSQIYLGVDSVTGKKVNTRVSGRTRKEVNIKAKQVKFDLWAMAQPFQKLKLYQLIKNWHFCGGIVISIL